MTRLAAYVGRELAAGPDPFAGARDLGFQAIEIPGLVLPLPQDEAALAEWADRLDRLGLTRRFHCSPSNNRSFFSADSLARSACLDRTIADIEGASRLGIDCVVIHPSAAKDAEDRGRVVDALGTLRTRADRLGVELHLECASGPFNGDPRELAGLCRDVPGIGIAMDIRHAFRSEFCRGGAGDLADWIEIAGPYVKSLQFNDFVREGDHAADAPVGRGEIPYEEIMPRLVELRCEWWTIELTAVDQLVKSREYLEPFLR